MVLENVKSCVVNALASNAWSRFPMPDRAFSAWWSSDLPLI